MEIRAKKGDITANQIIGLIILIVSFAIILLFFFMLNPGEEVDKEACRNSVVLRGTVPGGEVAVNLRCVTQDVCLSMGKDCIESSKNTKTIQVRDKQELLNSMSDLMYDCWWQMGAGKIEYEPRIKAGTLSVFCAVCNTVHFDDNIKSQIDNISTAELYMNLAGRQTSEGTSYLYYMSGFSSTDALRSSILSGTNGNVDIYKGTIDFKKPEGYALITSMAEKGWLEKTLGSAGTGAIPGVLMVVLGGAGPIGWTLLGVGALGGAAYGFVTSSENAYFVSPVYYPFSADELEKLECKDFSTLA